MNPHFQSNTTSPNPQTNPDDPQSGHSGPTGLPLFQDFNQNQPYAQSHHYTEGSPGYIPPNQYGSIQGEPFQARDYEKAELRVQLGKMEEEFKAGRLICCGLTCYEAWNAIILVPSFCLALIFFVVAVVTSNETDRFGYGILGATGLWLAVQSFFAISSDKTENIWMANVACWMMSIYLCVSVVFEGFSIWGLCHDSTYSVYVFLAASVNLLVHIFVNMKTVFKVRKYLIAREKIEKKLTEKAFNNNV